MKRITVSDIALRHPIDKDVFMVYIIGKGDMYKFKTYRTPPEIQDINVQIITPCNQTGYEDKIEVTVLHEQIKDYAQFKEKYKKHLVLDDSIPV